VTDFEAPAPAEQEAVLSFWVTHTKHKFPDGEFCHDCGADTHREYYRLRNDVWDNVAREVNRLVPDLDPLHYVANTRCGGDWCEGDCIGMLCIACVEDRLGRQLEPADFKPNAPANELPPGRYSKRLRNRMGLD
jgi:hypothetical protein